MPPVGFEPAIPASARPLTYALDRAATGIGVSQFNHSIFGAVEYIKCSLYGL
jgi:hypothetical protein